MSVLATDTFNNAELKPIYDGALCDDVALPAGVSYLAGQLLAPVAGTGSAVNDVQTFTVTGTPTGGSVSVFYAGLLVGTIAYNDTAAIVKTMLEAFFGVGNVTTSGGPLPGVAIVVTFQGESAGLYQQLMTNSTGFTGGSSPVLTITHTTPGKPAGGYFTKYIDGTNDPATRALKYDSYVDFKGNTFKGRSALSGFSVPQRGAPAFFSGYFKCADLISLDAAAVTDLGKLTNGTAYNSANAVLNIT